MVNASPSARGIRWLSKDALADQCGDVAHLGSEHSRKRERAQSTRGSAASAPPRSTQLAGHAPPAMLAGLTVPCLRVFSVWHVVATAAAHAVGTAPHRCPHPGPAATAAAHGEWAGRRGAQRPWSRRPRCGLGHRPASRLGERHLEGPGVRRRPRRGCGWKLQPTCQTLIIV